MAVTGTPITVEHLHVLPHSGPDELPAPWMTIQLGNPASGIARLQVLQNTAPSVTTVDDGTPNGPVQLQSGDVLFASTLSGTRAVFRARSFGRELTTVKRAQSRYSPIESTADAYEEGDVIIAGTAYRGACVGNTVMNYSWSGLNVAGIPAGGGFSGVAMQPTGDAQGNVGSYVGGVITQAGTAYLGMTGGGSGICVPEGDSRFMRSALIFASVPLVFPSNRIRSSVSEDAGSLFQATQAAAVELGLSEAFEYGEDVSAGWLRSFREALTPDQVAVSYYALPTRNQEMLVTVEGETNLGRLAGVYPAGIMVPATSIPGNAGGTVTAQQAIQHVTAQWASEHPWLSFAPIPDLRLMVPSAVAAPRQHYLDNPGDGVLTTAAVVIPQEGNERRSMREILDEWLAIFPGTIVRQTSTGVIELVPRVGPDAASGAAVTLTWGDLTGISDGEDDPSGVTNRCRVTSQGWEFTPNQALIAPSFVLVRAANGVTRAVLDGENVLPTDSREEHSIYDDLVFTGLTAPTAATVDVVIRAYGSWSPTTSSSFSLEGTATRQVTLAAGQAQDVSITHNSRSQNVTATFRLRRSADGGRIAVSAPGGIPESAGNPFGRTWFAYVLDVDVTGTAWVRSNERVESEFGQTGTTLPGVGGGDALADSRALYGERLAVINSNVFQLTPEQAQLVARSYVLANINPRTIRDVQQSEWDLYPVKFDHIGRLVDLPTGERAVIENRSYNDSFSSTHGAMTSSFSASVTEIVIDTTTDWLLLDNGDFMQLDSGTLLEVS